MFRCERCGTGFNPTVASAYESCPRCRAHGVTSKLSMRLFEAPVMKEAVQPEAKEESV